MFDSTMTEETTYGQSYAHLFSREHTIFWFSELEITYGYAVAEGNTELEFDYLPSTDELDYYQELYADVDAEGILATHWDGKYYLTMVHFVEEREVATGWAKEELLPWVYDIANDCRIDCRY